MLTPEEKNKMLYTFLDKNQDLLNLNEINFIKFMKKNDINLENIDISTLKLDMVPRVIGAILTMNNMSFEMKYPTHSHLLEPVEDKVKLYMSELMQKLEHKKDNPDIIGIVLFPNTLIPAGWDISIINWNIKQQ